MNEQDQYDNVLASIESITDLKLRLDSLFDVISDFSVDFQEALVTDAVGWINMLCPTTTDAERREKTRYLGRLTKHIKTIATIRQRQAASS